MPTAPINLLGRGWRNSLAELVSSAQSSLVVSSPYVTNEGVDLVAANLSDSFRRNGALFLVTDLSSMNVVQGSTDPEALLRFCSLARHYSLKHLPRLHAKVYIGDDRRAVITSGNLTAGGLRLNYEYGVEVFSHPLVMTVRSDITSYAELGASVSQPQLDSYCKAAKSVREAFRQQQASATRTLRLEFERKFRTAEDELIRMRLAGGAIHTVFAKTILFLLNKQGALPTPELHSMIESIHPDLCDNTVDRVIDGKSFGKKWKHAVRTAQQKLKQQGLVELHDGAWRIKDGNFSNTRR